MHRHSRRSFVHWASLAALGLTGGVPGRSFAQEVADGSAGLDLAIVNANIHTVDDRQPKAAALGVVDGRFAVVGSTAEIRAIVTRRTRVIDAEGMTIVPGFIDAHTHPAAAGAEHLMYVNCDHRSIAEIKEAIRHQVAKTPAGEWVIGFKYDDTKLTDGRPLLRTDLDEAAPKHPVRVTHRGGHTAIYNSVAFERAGITKDTPDPADGKFGRTSAGELSGYVAEKAVDRIKRLPIPSRAQARDGVKVISQLMTAAGLTSVHDADADKSNFLAYQDAREAGELLFRVYVMAHASLFDSWLAAGLRTGFGDNHLRIGGLKLYADGSASERTMRMSKPYIGRPNDFGLLVTTQDKLNEQVLAAHEAGFQVGVHANGDVAIDMVLNAFELANRLRPQRDPRFRIEHCTLVNELLLERMAKLGAIPTPFYTYVYYHGDKWAQYGEERTRSMFAHRSFLDHGIKVAGASDYVPGPFEPLMAMQSMVTRRDYKGRTWGENQKVAAAEALRICTLHGAYASFEEKQKGSITPGKLADFVLLAADPLTVDPQTIKDIKVVRTVIEGKTVYPLNAE
ncbi:N-substituted formamide deformylase precursor [Anatilimnocola aggregata]|uniref:N-substituted formamide deformylase n=1 Tax=Anatilimnocola aggregata TaxID=2528021 RepID=A0A517YLK4_9BACT|nr:amidohydrolase [Anatilimnocola aggregata]QDU31104.1 N-substituted formamide deformylase precursor [Anatilimnocola aggregata]